MPRCSGTVSIEYGYGFLELTGSLVDMSNFRSLNVWQRAYVFGLELYEVTQAFPTSERFGLVSQLRRAGVSVASNIAEGSRRHGNGHLIYFLNIARGSVGEIECQLQFARDLGYMEPGKWRKLDCEAQEISRMLLRLMNYLRSVEPGGRSKRSTQSGLATSPNSDPPTLTSLFPTPNS